MSVRWSPRPLQEVGHLAEHEPAVHVQQVAGGQDHHDRRDGRRAGVDLERADEGQELADEAGQAGQAGRGEDEEAEDRGVDRAVGAARPPILAMVRSWVRS